jgi:hypothetical protein
MEPPRIAPQLSNFVTIKVGLDPREERREISQESNVGFVKDG